MNIKIKKDRELLLLSTTLVLQIPCSFWAALQTSELGADVRYKLFHWSEQSPETSNSQLNRITLSGQTDRAVDGFVVKRGTEREKVMWRQAMNDVGATIF